MRASARSRVVLALLSAASCGEGAVSDGEAISLPHAPAASEPADAVTGVPLEALGTWYLDAAGERLVLTLTRLENAAGAGAAMRRERDPATALAPIESVSWDPSSRALAFRHVRDGDADWYRLVLADGVAAGRRARAGAQDRAPPARAYSTHVTGWNAEAFDRATTPRVFELELATGQRARLRIDRAPPPATGFVGTVKVYGSADNGALDEQDEYDIDVLNWTGRSVLFDTHDGDRRSHWAGVVSGRRIVGSRVPFDGSDPVAWQGVRAEVLTHGLTRRDEAEHAAWAARTRRQLQLLMMAGAPQPVAQTTRWLARDLAPMSASALAASRDDDAASWPAAYTLSEFELLASLPAASPEAPVVRRIHGVLARPSAPPPAGGYPALIALNGHGGSALQVMHPGEQNFWYGDAFARRGYVVVAIDVSHRPLRDREALYRDVTDGDNPAYGNDTHPAIAWPGFDSDWEEDGERAWDAMRAVDLALARADVDPTRVVTAGLSLGAEVSTVLGALDPRVAVTVSASFSADLGVMALNGNHPCWRWQHADVREYVDVSDLHALTAPRALLVQTGARDRTYSVRAQPFAADKQVLRRSRAAWPDGDAPLVFDLHADGHRFHVGLSATASGIRVPLAHEPRAPWSRDWQRDYDTEPAYPDLFTAVDALRR